MQRGIVVDVHEDVILILYKQSRLYLTLMGVSYYLLTHKETIFETCAHKILNRYLCARVHTFYQHYGTSRKLYLRLTSMKLECYKNMTYIGTRGICSKNTTQMWKNIVKYVFQQCGNFNELTLILLLAIGIHFPYDSARYIF